MDIHLDVIQSRFELGSKSYIFMENDKITSLPNLFQHLLSAEILSKWKIEFIYRENFPNQCKEQISSKVPTNILPWEKVSSWI